MTQFERGFREGLLAYALTANLDAIVWPLPGEWERAASPPACRRHSMRGFPCMQARMQKTGVRTVGVVSLGRRRGRGIALGRRLALGHARL